MISGHPPKNRARHQFMGSRVEDASLSFQQKNKVIMRYLATRGKYASFNLEFSKRHYHLLRRKFVFAISKNFMSTYLNVPKSDKEWIDIANRFYQR